METVLSELKLAVSDLTRVVDRVDWATRMNAKGYVSKASLTAEDVALQKAVVAVQQAANKRSNLEKYTKEKTIKELQAEVASAHSDELGKKATWDLETAKTDRLARDIAHCRMDAPADGELILAAGVEKGAKVHERQLIFRVLTETRAEPPR